MGWNEDGTVKDKSEVALPPLTSGALSSYWRVRCAGYLDWCDMDACALNANGLHKDLDGERPIIIVWVLWKDDRDTRRGPGPHYRNGEELGKGRRGVNEAIPEEPVTMLNCSV